MQVEAEMQAAQTTAPATPTDRPRDPIIATGVTFAEYMEKYAHDFAEFVDGAVIKLSSIQMIHDELSRFLEDVFQAYLHFLGGGKVFQAPMVMKSSADTRGREPDLMVLLPENVEKAKPTYIEGAADLVVEIISPESVERDRGSKFTEYERAGVTEYWIIDPYRKESLFYVLSDNGMYAQRGIDESGIYTSLVLPQLRLSITLLWQDPMPNVVETVEMVRALFTEGT